MARDFNGSTHFLYSATAGGVTSWSPTVYTFAVWLNTTRATNSDNILFLSEPAGNNFFGLLFDASGHLVFASKASSVAAANAVSSATVATGAWYHGCAVQAGLTSRTVYLNGGNTGTSATSQAPLNVTQTALAAYATNSTTISSPFAGRLAEAAVWGAALDAGEIQALARGLSPIQVRPGSLLGYWPLLGRSSPEIDLWRSNAMTVTGAVQADHPPVLYPRRRPIGVDAPVGGGGGGGGSVFNGTISIPIGISF